MNYEGGNIGRADTLSNDHTKLHIVFRDQMVTTSERRQFDLTGGTNVSGQKQVHKVFELSVGQTSLSVKGMSYL